MKKFNLLMLLLLLVTSISAQTFDLGEGRKATLDQAGNYRLTWNQKSQNGGSVSGTFSGKLKDGKRDGTWKGSFTYQLFSSDNSHFKSGTINFTRTYSSGIPNGAYSYNSTLKVCSGSYNYVSKQWKYTPFESFAEQITGSFKNGHADGVWSAYQQQPYEKISMQFDNGKAIGTWTIAEKTSQTLGFNNGYLVQQKEMRSDGWGSELSYAPDEKLEELPNQKTVKVSDFLAYGDYYMKGAGFDEWWRLYPENSSNEDYTAYYVLADYENHLKYIGNVPEWKKASLGIDDATTKRKAEEKEAQAFLDKYLPGSKEIFEGYNSLYNILGYPECNEIIYWKPICAAEPKIQMYGQRNEKILHILSIIKQETDFSNWALEKYKKLEKELTDAHVFEGIEQDSIESKMIYIIWKNYPDNWENILDESVKKWQNVQIEKATKDITPDDIYTYLLKHNYVTTQKLSGNAYGGGSSYKIIINGKLTDISKEAIIEHKKRYISGWINSHGKIDGFSYDDYMMTNGDRDSVFGNVLPSIRADKKLQKQLVKIGLLAE